MQRVLDAWGQLIEYMPPRLAPLCTPLSSWPRQRAQCGMARRRLLLLLLHTQPTVCLPATFCSSTPKLRALWSVAARLGALARRGTTTHPKAPTPGGGGGGGCQQPPVPVSCKPCWARRRRSSLGTTWKGGCTHGQGRASAMRGVKEGPSILASWLWPP